MRTNTYLLKTRILLFVAAILCMAILNLEGQTNFTASAAQQYSLKQLNTSISGTITNPTKKILQFNYYKNNLSFKTETLFVPVDENGFFKVDFDLMQSTEIQMVYDGHTQPLFIQIGDDLKASFDGNHFISSLNFTGRGSFNNQFMVDMSAKFNNIDKGYLLYEIAQRDGIGFKRHMDRILSQKNRFYENYNNAAKAKMTPEFKHYVNIENTYWHANQLINYRSEKLLLSGTGPVEFLPSSFYGFLDNLDMTNTVMLSNRNYCEFLEEFLKFKGEQAALDNALNYADKIVEEPNVLYTEDGSFVHFSDGEKISILDEELSKINKKAIARLLPVFEVEDLNYIKLQNGRKGWVGNLKAALPTAKNNGETKSEERIKKYAICKKYNAKLYEDPQDQSSIVTALGYGEEVNYLHLQTSEYFNYYHQGVEYYGKLVQVENKKNQRGWILDSFIEVKEKKVLSKDTPAPYLYSLTDTSDARQHLKGEALNYTLAKALYWKIKLNKSKDIAREIAAFASQNEYKGLNEVLRAEYDVEQLRKKSNDAYIETYAYSNLQSPVITGVEIGLPFEKSAFISATKSQSEKEYTDISCQLADRPTSIVQLSGKMFSSYNKQVNLTIVYDYISYKEERIEISANSEGNYNFSTSLKDPVLAFLECGGNSLELYLYPGDHIKIDFDTQNFPNSVQFDGKSAELNTYLFNEQKLFKTQFDAIKIKEKTSSSADEFAKLAKSLFKARSQYLEKYKRKHSLKPQDYLFISSNVYFSYAAQMFGYEDTQRFMQKKEIVELPNGYYDFLNGVQISVEGILPNKHYASFIHQFLDYQMKMAVNEDLSKLEVANQFFAGEVLAFINAKELAIMCQLGKSYEYGKSIQKFIDNNTFAQFNDVLRVVYNENKPIQNGATAPDFSLSDINGEQVKLSDLKGKVVYIDFWATWCRPCIKAMTYSQRLLNEYDDEEVVFLYVSMDENDKIWKSYVASQDLHGIQLNARSGRGYLSDIAKLYKVKQLPTFVIIDKEGKIAFNQAGSPGSKVVSNILDGLLAKPKF